MISGKHVKTFKDAKIAIVADLPLNADYPHFSFDVEEVRDDKVILKSHQTGEKLELPIIKANYREFAAIDMKSTFEKMMNMKTKRFRIYPMDGERI